MAISGHPVYLHNGEKFQGDDNHFFGDSRRYKRIRDKVPACSSSRCLIALIKLIPGSIRVREKCPRYK